VTLAGKASKSAWNAIEVSMVGMYHKVGYRDLVCYQTGCAGAITAIYDGYRCAIGDDCEALGMIWVNSWLKNKALMVRDKLPCSRYSSDS
jgi:hypothetical protein